MSATADLADVVLPACTYLEKTDLLSLEQLLPAVHADGGQAAVGVEVGSRRGEPGRPEDGRRPVLRQDARRVPQGAPAHRRPGERRLHRHRPHLGPAHERRAAPQHADGALRARSSTRSSRPSRARSSSTSRCSCPYEQEVCDYKEPIEASPSNALAKKYPLTFLSTHTKFRTHSQYCDLPWLNEITANGQGFLEINPTDAKARGIADGNVVRVFNDRGEMKVYAQADRGDQARRGQLLPGRLGHATRSSSTSRVTPTT